MSDGHPPTVPRITRSTDGKRSIISLTSDIGSSPRAFTLVPKRGTPRDTMIDAKKAWRGTRTPIVFAVTEHGGASGRAGRISV